MFPREVKTAAPTMGSMPLTSALTTPSALAGSCKAPSGHFVFVESPLSPSSHQAGQRVFAPVGRDEKGSESSLPIHTHPMESPPLTFPVLAARASAIPMAPRRLGIRQALPLLLSQNPTTDVLKTLRGFLSSSQNRHYRFTIGNNANMTTSGTGAVNLVTSVATIEALSEWSAFSTLFDEFFVEKMLIRFVPTSRYQYGIGAAPGTTLTSIPLTVTSLHHGVSAYSTQATAMENMTTQVVSSSDPWTHEWKNVESSRSSVLPSPSTSSPLATQSWCLTAAAAAQLYTGQVLYLGGNTLGPASSTTFGQVLFRYSVLFRLRA